MPAGDGLMRRGTADLVVGECFVLLGVRVERRRVRPEALVALDLRPERTVPRPPAQLLVLSIADRIRDIEAVDLDGLLGSGGAHCGQSGGQPAVGGGGHAENLGTFWLVRNGRDAVQERACRQSA